MPWLVLIVVALLLIAMAPVITCKSASEYPNFAKYVGMVKMHANKHGLDWRLVAAHITVESGWLPTVESTAHAVGLGQILCEPDGQGGCSNKFNIDIWPSITHTALLDPDTNIETACQIIAWNQQKYGLYTGIAVYEDWSARGGVVKDALYVERVLCVLHKLQTEYPT